MVYFDLFFVFDNFRDFWDEELVYDDILILEILVEVLEIFLSKLSFLNNVVVVKDVGFNFLIDGIVFVGEIFGGLFIVNINMFVVV